MLLGLSGSLRQGSSNSMLVREAGRIWSGPFEMGDIRVPLYDGDLEDSDGVPEQVERLAAQIAAADAVVISTPEYNQSLSGVLKNALDWVSRVKPGPWADRPVALMSAAAGRSGGARGGYALRLAMTPFKARLIGAEVMLADARNQFDADGRLINDRATASLQAMVTALETEARR